MTPEEIEQKRKEYLKGIVLVDRLVFAGVILVIVFVTGVLIA